MSYGENYGTNTLVKCLRNLVEGNHECDSCEYDNDEGKCDFKRRMEELGVPE